MLRFFILVLATGLIQIAYAAPPILIDQASSPGTNINLAPQGVADVDQLIIKYKPTSGIAAAQLAAPNSKQLQTLSAIAGIKLSYARAMSGSANVLRMAQSMTAKQAEKIAASLMKNNPNIEYAQPDYRVYPLAIPNDPQFANQWHYSAANGMNLPNAWNITTGSTTSIAAVIDTGILNHADLAGKTVGGYDMITDPVVAGDGNGRDPNPADPGDWVTANQCFAGSKARNSSWHGTHVAGTIGAATNNGLGVAGVDWNTKILPIRVLGHCGGRTSDIVDGIRWAAGITVPGTPINPNKATVINMSLGGQHACSAAEQSAITAAINAGVTVVVAAGNSSLDAAGFAPASCNGVITVAAHGPNKDLAYYSNFGTTVEITAPGGAQRFANDPNGILSTLDSGTTTPLNDNAYVYYQGTSMAAPHIAGLVTLMQTAALAGTPARLLTPAEISTLIQNTAVPFAAGTQCAANPTWCGKGRADAAAAVAAAAAYTGTPPPPPPPPPAGKPTAPKGFKAWTTSSTKGKLTWIDVANETGYKIYFKSGRKWRFMGKAPANTTTVGIRGFRPENRYSFRIKAFNASGATWSRPSSVWALAQPAKLRCKQTRKRGQTRWVTCTWQDRSRHERRYAVQSNTGAGYKTIGTIRRNSRGVIIRYRGYPRGTRAAVRVQAIATRAASTPSRPSRFVLR